MSLLEHLEGVKRTGKDRYIARCPAHADKRPSLSVREMSDGRILLHCFAGCDVEAVLSALGLTFSDVMPERLGDFKRERPAFTAKEAMECLVLEAGYLAVFGADAQKGIPPTDAELDRLAVCTGRIRAALEFCYGR